MSLNILILQNIRNAASDKNSNFSKLYGAYSELFHFVILLDDCTVGTR